MQALLPVTSVHHAGAEPMICDPLPAAKRERKVKTPAEAWADDWTLPQIEAHVAALLPGITRPKRATKLWLTQQLCDAGFVKPVLPNNKLSCLAKNLKLGMGEPLELIAKPVPELPALRQIEDTDLAVDETGTVVGAVCGGVLINLEEPHVEQALGLRLSLDMFCIKRQRTGAGTSLGILDEASDEE